jgi:hypothetical protein
MNLLLDFFCRFGWGLAAGLVLTPVTLVPAGFFRVNLLVILGLATAAAVVARGLPDGSTAWLPAALAAVVAWLGSVAWLGEKTRAGRWASGIVAALLAAATFAVAAPAGRSGSLPAAWTAGGEALISGLVSGLAVHAMLLGHWYLNAPGMRVDALRRMIDLALAAWAVQGVIALAGLVAGPGIPSGTTATALVALRWLAGLVGLPVLLVMARKTLEIPNTQSATGILYVACLAAILGELTSQLLRAAA